MELAPDLKREADITTYGPDAICDSCGLRCDDDVHGDNDRDGTTKQPNMDGPDEPPEGPTETTNEPPTDEPPKGNGGDEPTDEEPPTDEPKGDEPKGDEPPKGDGPDGGDEPKGDEPGGDDEPPTEEPKRGKMPDLPTESGGGASDGGDGEGAIPQGTLEALQRAIDEMETLEGDPEVGKGQVLRNINDIPKDRRAADNWYSTRDNSGVYQRATASIRAAFMRSKQGRDELEDGYRTGRLSQRTLHRVAEQGEDRLFGRRNQPSVGRYNLWVLVDCSSSMMGDSIAQATAVAKAFATATQAIGSIRTSVWGWSNPFAPDKVQQSNPYWGAVLVYQSPADPRTIDALRTVPMGGTPDAQTLSWAIDAIRRDTRSGETPLVVMVSDGGGWDLSAITARAKKHGVHVIGVNIGWSRSSSMEEHLTKSYGKGNFVSADNAADMAGPLGRLIAKVITPR